jgi:hypothetical protein
MRTHLRFRSRSCSYPYRRHRFGYSGASCHSVRGYVIKSGRYVAPHARQIRGAGSSTNGQARVGWSLMIIRRLLVIGQFILVLIFLTPGQANTITAADVNRVQDLFQTAANIASDITSAGNSIITETLSSGRLSSDDDITAACLIELKGTSEHIAYSLHEFLVTAGISSGMKERSDEGLSLTLTKLSLKTLSDYLPKARATVNEIQIGCRTSGLVSAKAQLILGLIPLIDKELTPLAQRIVARLRQ